MSQIRIGTSGWHYKHWVGRYNPSDIKPAAMLEHYLRDFDTVELNNTFYHTAQRDVIRCLAEGGCCRISCSP